MIAVCSLRAELEELTTKQQAEVVKLTTELVQVKETSANRLNELTFAHLKVKKYADERGQLRDQVHEKDLELEKMKKQLAELTAKAEGKRTTSLLTLPLFNHVLIQPMMPQRTKNNMLTNPLSWK